MLLFPLLLQSGVTYPLQSLDLNQVTQEWGQARANRSVDNNPLRIAGWEYKTGVGTHANSLFRIKLNGGAKSISGQCGVDDEGQRGSVEFQIWIDGKKAWVSGLMKSGMQAKKYSLALTGAKEIRLVVTDGGDGIDYDHADWVDTSISMKPGARAPLAVRMIIPVEPPMPIAKVDPQRLMINGPRVIGTTPGRPFLFKIPVSGAILSHPGTFVRSKDPIFHLADLSIQGDMPPGLTFDPADGTIKGSVAKPGNYTFRVLARNRAQLARRTYTITAGDHKLALTPPMGWNSWNIWATAVDAKKVRDSADAFIHAGLADYGYQYINIDDAWEGKRDSDGMIRTNAKFGDMKALADYVHGLGLKLGIYSGPGPRTCAGYEASYKHEYEDAKQYANWGIDYLKYDWCAYGELFPRPTLAEMKYPYALMRTQLDRVDRDIVFSFCQYGMGDVYKWGKDLGGNLWRTTGDITDTWQSMSSIGFAHSEKAVGVSPGGWNDPDMLVVGRLGWGPNPRPSRLTPNEQITHITLWSMLAAPLIIGCDLTKLDDFTKRLLCNHDVIEIDQDPLGKPATRKWVNGDLEVWARPLWDGTTGVALFNRGPEKASVTARWKDIGISGVQPVRDLWQMKSLGNKSGISATVPAHGAMLFRVGTIKE